MCLSEMERGPLSPEVAVAGVQAAWCRGREGDPGTPSCVRLHRFLPSGRLPGGVTSQVMRFRTGVSYVVGATCSECRFDA